MLSAPIVGIHNPQGDLQKISFGNITDYESCSIFHVDGSFDCLPTFSGSANSLSVVFSLGITDGGSSGSGLWIVYGSSHYLVGQLKGGLSSCDTPHAPDDYGRFDVAYNAALSQWLGPTSVNYTLSVMGGGAGQGMVTGPGINCTISAGSASGTCSANYASGTGVSLTAASIGVSTFTGWGGDCAGFGVALICPLTMSDHKSVGATFTATSLPTAAVSLNGSEFHTGQTIDYQATLTPGSIPTQVDIYLGVLLPDGVTFLSLVPSPRGTIVFASPSGPVLVPFAANVTRAQTVVLFPYSFTGTELVGTYYTYAGLAVAGSDPLQAANRLSLGVQAFQFTP